MGGDKNKQWGREVDQKINKRDGYGMEPSIRPQVLNDLGHAKTMFIETIKHRIMQDKEREEREAQREKILVEPPYQVAPVKLQRKKS